MVVENCMYCFETPLVVTDFTPGEIPHDEAENQIPVLVTGVSKSAAPQKKVSVAVAPYPDLVLAAAVQTVSPPVSPSGLIFKSDRERPAYASVKQFCPGALFWASTAKISRK